MRKALFAAMTGLTLVTAPDVGLTEPRWPAPVATYRFEMTPGCRPPSSSPSTGACADQMARFIAARSEAASNGKTLLVVFGATWCPSCKSLAKILPAAVSDSGSMSGGRIHVVDITLSTLHAGKVTAVPSGEAVRADLMTARPDFKQRAIPFIAVLDPVSGATSARNLDDLEQAGAWNTTRLAHILAAAEREALGQGSAPAEPSWLARKWKRWFGD